MWKKILILLAGLVFMSCTNTTINTVDTKDEPVGYFAIDIEEDANWYWHNNADYTYDWFKTENKKEYYNVYIFVDKTYFMNKLYRGEYNFGYCKDNEIKITLY